MLLGLGVFLFCLFDLFFGLFLFSLGYFPFNRVDVDVGALEGFDNLMA